MSRRKPRNIYARSGVTLTAQFPGWVTVLDVYSDEPTQATWVFDGVLSDVFTGEQLGIVTDPDGGNVTNFLRRTGAVIFPTAIEIESGSYPPDQTRIRCTYADEIGVDSAWIIAGDPDGGPTFVGRYMNRSQCGMINPA